MWEERPLVSVNNDFMFLFFLGGRVWVLLVLVAMIQWVPCFFKSPYSCFLSVKEVWRRL